MAELTAVNPPTADLFGSRCRDAARAELDAAAAATTKTIADCEKQRKVAEAAAKQLGERDTGVALLRDKLAAEQGQIDPGA